MRRTLIRTLTLALLLLVPLTGCQTDEEQAEELFRQAMGFSSSDATQALNLLSQVLDLDPTRLDAQEEIAVIHLDSEDFQSARDAAQVAVSEAVIATPRALETLGRAQAGLGEWEQAAVALNRSTETDPGRTYLLPEIARAEESSGDPQAALAAFRQALEAEIEPAESSVAIARLLVDQLDASIGDRDLDGLPSELEALSQDIEASLRSASNINDLSSELDGELAALSARFERLLPDEPEEQLAVNELIRAMGQQDAQAARNSGILAALAEQSGMLGAFGTTTSPFGDTTSIEDALGGLMGDAVGENYGFGGLGLRGTGRGGGGSGIGRIGGLGGLGSPRAAPPTEAEVQALDDVEPPEVEPAPERPAPTDTPVPTPIN